MENLNLKVESATGEIIIREGEAAPQVVPQKLKLAGNILSVAAFLAARYENDKEGSGLQVIDPSTTVVVVDEKEMTITMFLNPNYEYGTEVVGKLEFTEEFKQWSINSNKTFSREELIKLIRFNRRYFPDLLKHEALLTAYQKLSISTTGELNQSSDPRGNRSIAFDKKVNSDNIPLEFILNVPIFKGFQPEQFRVEVCLDATDATVRFWFESVELAERIEILKEAIFADQLDHCKDFVVIRK